MGHHHGHAHDHHHAHGHGHHHHVPTLTGENAGAVRRALIVVLAIAAAFMTLEIVGGIYADSLALLSDAAHMFTDCAAYAIALYAAHIARA
jgi:cobalt-zinc-cadmium efflux system protein